MALTAGDRIGPYEIERFLGAGGFGSVYRARDPRLARDVAIKVLLGEIAHDPERLASFRKEARAAAALSHPHICTVHEVEHSNGVDFIVMELVDGRSLAELIPSHGLQVPASVRYGTQIADALAHAHARGVVHGDLKARNVMVTEAGEVKIVDFGLARRVLPVDGATRTETSPPSPTGTAGTPAYMAPETLQGEVIDARSDIWALGVLLHEMMTGAQPFPGRTVAEVTSAILRDPPRQLPPHVPPGLAAVIRRCLAKDARERYTTAGEVRSALETAGFGSETLRDPVAAAPAATTRRRAGVVAALAAAAAALAAGTYWWRAGPTSTQPTTLAVLPCHALTEREGLGFLEVGIADSVIIALSNAAELRVRSTQGVLQYATENIDPRDVGRTLAVEYVLTCTLQPEPDRVAATVQLVKTEDGTTIWGDRFDVKRGNLLELRDRISEQVTSALSVRLTATERERFYRRYTQNSSAYERYLEGRSELARYTREATLKAIDHFNGALAIDPAYGLAHAGLAAAASRMRIRFATAAERDEWRDIAHREAAEAIRLDPDLAEAHEALAAVARESDYDWVTTVEESNRALALNPSLAMPHFYCAGAFYHLGLFERAEREVRLGTANDPQNRVEALRLHGNVALLDGRFADAVAHLTEAQRLSEQSATGTYLALALYYNGSPAEGEAMLEDLVSATGTSPVRARAALASVLAARGDRARAAALADAVRPDAGNDHHAAYSLGAAYAQLGDTSEALRWLERAAAAGFLAHAWFARDPLLTPLRSEAGFQKLLVDLEQRVRAFEQKHGH